MLGEMSKKAFHKRVRYIILADTLLSNSSILKLLIGNFHN